MIARRCAGGNTVCASTPRRVHTQNGTLPLVIVVGTPRLVKTFVGGYQKLYIPHFKTLDVFLQNSHLAKQA